MQDRDRRALAFLGVSGLLSAIAYFWPASGPEVVTAAISTPQAAQARLAKLRGTIATMPGKKKLLEGIEEQLKTREKGLIVADTAAQAQAQLMQVVSKLARAQSPPVDILQRDMGAIQPLGKDYGETMATVTFNCQIEQLVNLLADISAQPELIATHELTVRAADPRKKLVTVRLTVTGVIPRRLVPERKGPMTF